MERRSSLRVGNAVVDHLARLCFVSRFSQTVEGEQRSSEAMQCCVVRSCWRGSEEVAGTTDVAGEVYSFQGHITQDVVFRCITLDFLNECRVVRVEAYVTERARNDKTD